MNTSVSCKKLEYSTQLGVNKKSNVSSSVESSANNDSPVLPSIETSIDDDILEDGKNFASSFAGSEEGEAIEKFYTEYFQPSSLSTSTGSLYDIRSGSYQNITKKDIDKYFPEGFAGEMEEEFEFTQNSAWMIRDSTKLLYRWLEETEQQLKYHNGDAIYQANLTETTASTQTARIDRKTVGMHSVIEVPRLTDRKDFSTTQPVFTYYGQDLLQASATTTSAPSQPKQQSEEEGEGGKFEVTKGTGSWLETTVESLRSTVTSDNDKLPYQMILSGSRGCGKSVLLNQCVYYARQRGWLCLFVPNGWDQVQSGPYIQPISVSNTTSSSSSGSGSSKSSNTNKVIYDNPFMTKVILRGFWRAHHKTLKTLPIANVSTMNKYDKLLATYKKAWNQALSVQGRDKLSFTAMRSIVKGEDHFADDDKEDENILKNYQFLLKSSSSQLITLEDLILLGIAVSELSGLTFVDLVEELKELATTNNIPVMFAVDQYNTWLVDSAFSYQGKNVVGTDMCVPYALKFISTKKNETAAYQMKHGLCIAATSFKHTEGKKVTLDEEVKASLPLRYRVRHYNQREYLAAMSYYLHNSPVDNSMIWEDFLLFRMHTASIPRLCRIESVPFFYPRAVKAYQEEFELATLIGVSDPDRVVDDEFDPELGYDTEEDEGEFQFMEDDGVEGDDEPPDDGLDWDDESLFDDDDDDEEEKEKDDKQKQEVDKKTTNK